MKKIPKYKSLRIILISGIFYFFLVMPFMGFIFLQEIPKLIDKGFFEIGPLKGNVGSFHFHHQKKNDSLASFKFDGDSQALGSDSAIKTIALAPKMVVNSSQTGLPNSGSSPVTTKADNSASLKNPKYFSISFNIFFYGMEIALILIFLFSYPFKKYFRFKRKGKDISTKLEFFCRRYLLYTPLINAGIFGLVMIATVGYIGYINMFKDLSDNINANIFGDYFYIAALAAFLSTLFVFYWQKHRVHINYLEVLFDEEELRKRIFRKSISRIRNRLWLASGMTTLLPLAIVIFYIALSISKISDLNIDLANAQIRQIILGNYSELFHSTSDLGDLYYVNSVNAYMMFFGIGTSISISLIYILTFVKWTTQDIVFPVKELLSNMQKTSGGQTTNFSIVRTNDEIGELAEGFNMMSLRIKNYIDHINKTNTSYYRFVPKQFLDFLDKKHITDIHLGDQVQKEMTVMFSDIRSFTEISENMSPRDSFNFINHYLGFMEPVISRNNGFIDKYIGDAIMALFAESVDDALDAAIEMRAKLQEFNNDLKLRGETPINSGIGINTGMLMLGIVGGKGRIEGTVISDHVNLASRLEGLTKKYGASIIISQNTLIKIQNPKRYQYRFLDEVKVKGKRNSVNIYEILDGETAVIRQAKVATIKLFNQALQLYRSRQFEKALGVFQDIGAQSPHDMATQLYINRCTKFIKKGIPKEWDGSETWTSK